MSHATTNYFNQLFKMGEKRNLNFELMPMYPNKFYHIYNRGNNKQKVFFSDANYYYFTNKLESFIIPHCYILAFCLMPNHFHILVYTKKNYEETRFKNDYRTLLSSYTRGINKERNRTGSLFQQNSKFKEVDPLADFDPNICFNYIHLNPIKAFLVNELLDWKHSSYHFYAKERKHAILDSRITGMLLQREMSGKKIRLSTESDSF